MRINHNISSLDTQGALFRVNRDSSKSLEKLSTGLRINRASDDAAGLGVSENLRTQVNGLGQASKNTQDFISLLQIAEGALNEQTNILQRMRELTIQAKNDTYTDTERGYMGEEFMQLGKELDRIAQTTNFNGMRVFFINSTVTPQSATSDPKRAIDARDAWDDPADAVFGADDNGGATIFNMMVGANYSSDDVAAANDASQFYSMEKTAENLVTIQFGQMGLKGLFNKNASVAGVGWNLLVGGATYLGNPFVYHTNPPGPAAPAGMDAANFGSLGNKLNTILQLIDGKELTDLGGTGPNACYTGDNYTGLERVNRMRSYIGAMVNRLEHNMNNLIESQTNQQAAESLIRDVDFASETATFTKNQILTQTATSMLAQANMKPTSVLQLLR